MSNTCKRPACLPSLMVLLLVHMVQWYFVTLVHRPIRKSIISDIGERLLYFCMSAPTNVSTQTACIGGVPVESSLTSKPRSFLIKRWIVFALSKQDNFFFVFHSLSLPPRKNKNNAEEALRIDINLKLYLHIYALLIPMKFKLISWCRKQLGQK